MKTPLLAAVVLGIATSSLFGQGYVSFGNSATTLVTTNDMQGHVGTAAVGTFTVALYWGILGSTEGQLVQVGPSVASSADGAFFGGNYATGNATSPGTAAAFEVKGWTGNFADFEAASAAAPGNSSIFVGVSGLFNVTTSASFGPFPTIYPPPPGGTFSGLQLQTVPAPEPTTLALGGLGAAGLLLFRRRK